METQKLSCTRFTSHSFIKVFEVLGLWGGFPKKLKTAHINFVDIFRFGFINFRFHISFQYTVLATLRFHSLWELNHLNIISFFSSPFSLPFYIEFSIPIVCNITKFWDKLYRLCSAWLRRTISLKITHEKFKIVFDLN